jgi:diguanylate cyclase (GGDEF)-like protein
MSSLGRKGRAFILASHVLFLITLWGVAAFWAITDRSLTLAASERQLGQITTAVAEQTLGWLRLVNLALLNAEQWISENPRQDPGTSPEFRHLVESTRSVSGNLSDIRLVTKKGGLAHVGGKASAPLVDVSDREYFRVQQDQATRGFYIAQSVKSRVTGKWGIPFSFPVSNPAAETGVVFGAMELDRIIPLHEKERPKPGGSIALIRTDGRFLSRVPFDEAYMTRTLAGTEVFDELVLRQEGGVLHHDGSNIDGVPRLVGFVRLKDYPLVVVVTETLDDIMAPWRRQFLIVGAILVSITVLAAALLQRLWSALRQNEKAQALLEHQASIDGLTGLMNRRAFMEAAGREFGRARRADRPLSVLMLDLDHFKDINDTLGHAAGDTVLRLLGALLPQFLRSNDLVGRLGGEEFCVLLPEVGSERAREVCERLCRGFADTSEATAGLSRRVTLSGGVAESRPADENLAAVLQRADQALYRAKALGRDRVELASA